jgi:hypothetical protein
VSGFVNLDQTVLKLPEAQMADKVTQKRVFFVPLAQVTGCIDVPMLAYVNQFRIPFMRTPFHVVDTAVRIIGARNDDGAER